MKIAIYTCIFGNYDQLIPQPVEQGVDYICFTDQNFTSSVWQIKQVPPAFPKDFSRSNRYYKINPHLCLPEYDASIYIDGNVLVIHPIKHLLDCVFSKSNMAVFAHTPPVENPSNCIYKEYDRIVDFGQNENKWFDSNESLDRHVKFLRAEQYPEQNGLGAGAVLIRKHNQPDVIGTMNVWWNMVKEYSKRDQLSFNYSAWKTNFNFTYIPGEVRYGNPWFWRLGGHNQKLWLRMMKYKIRTRMGRIPQFNEQEFLKQMGCE